MKLHINKLYNELQRVKYAIKYGKWYSENEENFQQFLNLTRGELSVIEYFDQFSRLQDVCGLEDDEEHDLTTFLRGLRLDIFQKMNRNIYEAYFLFMRHIGKQFMLSTCLNKLVCNKIRLKKENHRQ